MSLSTTHLHRRRSGASPSALTAAGAVPSCQRWAAWLRAVAREADLPLNLAAAIRARIDNPDRVDLHVPAREAIWVVDAQNAGGFAACAIQVIDPWR